MHFVDTLGSKSKQENIKNFHEIALKFLHSSMPSTETFHITFLSIDGIDGCRNIRAMDTAWFMLMSPGLNSDWLD